MDVDDVLRLILERVDSQISLIRAASTCKQWRRVIADADFLRRYRSLHEPTLAGDYCDYSHWPPGPGGYIGAEARTEKRRHLFVPAPSSSIDTRRHCSLDFLPDHIKAWSIMDSRGSLLLMCKHRTPFIGHGGMIVCEPLTRCYRTIPELPAEWGSYFCNFFNFIWGSFLIDGECDEIGGRIGVSNFRVLCKLYSDEDDVVHGAMFTATAITNGQWSKKVMGNIAAIPKSIRHMGRTAGSWCFHDEHHKLIVLDSSTGEFSSSSMLPPAIIENLRPYGSKLYITDCRNGKPRMYIVSGDVVKVFSRFSDGEWAIQNRAKIEPGLIILTTGLDFIVLKSVGQQRGYFCLDLQTMNVTPMEEDIGRMAYRCELPWPPTLRTFV